MTFAGVLLQSSSADPALSVDALGLCFAFVLPDHGKFRRHLQILCWDAGIRVSPSRGSKKPSLVQGEVARTQTRQCQICVSV